MALSDEGFGWILAEKILQPVRLKALPLMAMWTKIGVLSCVDPHSFGASYLHLLSVRK